jgi:DNA-binding MarR family transcriptional regulator
MIASAKKTADLARGAAADLLMTVPHVMSTLRAQIRRCGDMEHAQFRVLMTLLHGPRGAGDLADRFEVSAPTMSRTLDVLVEREWVSRERDTDDRRRVLVALTPKGKGRLERIREDAIDHLTQVLRGLSDAELRRLSGGLEVLAGVVREHHGHPHDVGTHEPDGSNGHRGADAPQDTEG